MRIIEIILLLIVTVFPIYISIKNYSLNKKSALVFIGIVFLIHLIFEGFRWQMIPSYLLILILTWCIFKEYSFFKGGLFRKIITGIGFAILIIFAWVLPYILPVFDLPTPSGKYKVGAQDVHLITDEEETITLEAGDKRELMVKVWYPAKINNEEKEVYLNDAERIGFSTKYGAPKGIFNYLDHVETNTFKKPDVAEGKFPVLIFSHGHQSNATGYYAILEDIVSHGYIVLNINHTYESVGSLFPDGEIKLYSKEFEKIQLDEKMSAMTWSATQELEKAKTNEEEYAAVKDLIRDYVAGDIGLRWSNDISMVIDALEKGDTFSFFATHINTSKIGVFGHSQGATAAGQGLLNDKRIKAGISIDGILWGAMIDTTLTKPFAILSADWDYNAYQPDLNKHIFRNGTANDFYQAKILNAGHSNFMDIPYKIRIPVINEAGSIKPEQASRISSKFVLQFFNKYLIGQNINLLKLEDEYAELELVQEN
ncbi:alpha/beta hydrolase family protein [Marivirga sp.]|uniref:alpha/beta hydrolase family protein n=1 Tax=Marivirga sp. TaxID=2018662 RepID=UPI003DA720AC